MLVEPIRKKSDVKRLLQHLAPHPRNYALFVIGINCGLRYSDLARICVKDVKGLAVGESFFIQEKKTKKRREIVINNAMHDAIEKLLTAYPYYKPHEPIFQGSIRGEALTWRSANELVKQWGRFLDLRFNVGTHTLRKTFGYHQRKYGGVAIELIQRALNHKHYRDTERYIGIEDVEVREIPLRHEVKY